jgi:hypothetical protein
MPPVWGFLFTAGKAYKAKIQPFKQGIVFEDILIQSYPITYFKTL